MSESSMCLDSGVATVGTGEALEGPHRDFSMKADPVIDSRVGHRRS